MSEGRKITNRSAEKGGIIIANTDAHVWPKSNSGSVPIAIKVIEDASIELIKSPTMEGIDWYNGKTIEAEKTILADISELTLSGGVVQVIYK